VSGLSVIAGLLGLGLAGAGLLALWDSFGVLPGHRGIKRAGVYSFLRHPIYAGYLLTAVAWTFGHPSGRNLTILVAFAVLTVMRLLREERLLSADPAYLRYASSTSSRLIPGVF
jgi:protein-S-isoprenylcysteine O-methyltransferase Ste14